MSAAIVYSHALSPRLQYVVDFLSGYYRLPFKLTSDEAVFAASPITCKINYSYHQLLEGELWIHPHALLFESAVHPVKVECFERAATAEGATAHACFFKAEGDLHFDLLAAVFFLITRYEEYLPHKKDAFGRYAHQNSVAFRHHFLHLPLVNIWLEDLRQLLAQKNSSFAQQPVAFQFLPTYDIDMAWSFLHKGLQRNAAVLAQQFVSGKWRAFGQRIAVLRQKKQDPFDAYAWMDQLHETYGLKPIYFFLVAEETSRFDKNIPLQNPAFQHLIRDLAGRYPLGVHPSWQSGERPELLRKEVQSLGFIAGRDIRLSRQHFIRFELPATYRRLIAAGIEQDYSMGYGSINGFRASITTPYYWYDLKNEEATRLQIHPFCFMDANAYYEQKLTPEGAAKELAQYYHVVRSVQGQFISIWHNNFLGTAPEFAGWREVYKQFVQSVVEGE